LLICFLKRAGHLIGELSSFDMRVVFTNDFLGVVEYSGSSCVPGRADEDLAGSASSAVRHQIVVVIAEFDTCLITQPLDTVG